MAAADVTVNFRNSPLTAFSCSINVTTTATDSTITSVQLLASAPISGPLFDFLNAPYADAAAADAAFRNAGGFIILRQTGGTANASEGLIKFVASAAKPAILIIQTGTDAVYEVKVAIANGTTR